MASFALFRLECQFLQNPAIIGRRCGFNGHHWTCHRSRDEITLGWFLRQIELAKGLLVNFLQ